ncbi:TPA: hypothetical protein JG825_003473 [Vibrio parahaemolyticus]|uniref:RAQPRD family integrative conjugative element protein n=2 Tax=Vibrio TaxID=662 RepID=UPI0018F114D2|nr:MULTISPECIES: RAQPRD family integrative conjugative element protein [Vibrio harveyi group]MCR9909679.1 RAQPRD family integrative conjugative element protein [Vibrio campbellii]UPR19065.1 hypothetical protein H9J99_25810 [Vibrio parahaemolyticus]HAV1520154.1 hypothetical protein [Vibrio parahaemolyticus]HAV1539121.1 hypothetical protein [Vibrio parahaemolyticus]
MNLQRFSVVVPLLATSLIVQAAPERKDVELDALRRISSELNVVKDMLKEAKRYQEAGDPEPFLYGEAERDLNVLIMGFEDYIEGRFDPTYEREPLRFEGSLRREGVIHGE